MYVFIKIGLGICLNIYFGFFFANLAAIMISLKYKYI